MSLIEADSEFTAEDRGKYRPADVDGFTADEVEAKIMAALADSDGHDDGRAFRTLPRIKEHAELSKASDIGEIIHSMIADKKIRRHENADFTAYFLYEEKPTRYWRNGDGTVGADFPDEDEPHPFADLIGKPAVPTAYSQPILDQKPYSKAPIEILPDELEEAMALHGSTTLAAKELEVGYSTLYSKMNGQAALKQASERGLKRYREAHPKTEKKPKQEKTMSTAIAPVKAETNTHPHSPKGIEWSVKLFREAHNNGENQTELAQRLGVAGPAVSQQLRRNPEFKAAFYGVSIEEVENAENEKKSRPKSIVSPKSDLLERLEQLAFEGLTIPKAAAEVGLPYDTLLDNIKDRRPDKSIMQAWERGLIRRKKALANFSDELPAGEQTETTTDLHDCEIAEPEIQTSPTNPQSPSSSIVMEIQPDETPNNAGNETPQAGTANVIANDVDEPFAVESMYPSFEGRIERFEPVDPFSSPAHFPANEIPQTRSIRVRDINAAVIEETPNADRPTSIMKEIFDVQREAAAEFSQTPVSTRCLPFGNGGQLMIGFEGDYFDLSRDERRFLETMADRFDGYGKPIKRPRTVLQRIADWLANP